MMISLGRQAAAGAAMCLAVGLLTACGIQPEPLPQLGSGGQGALPNMSQSLTGITIVRPLGSPGVGAVDRNGGSTE